MNNFEFSEIFNDPDFTVTCLYIKSNGQREQNGTWLVNYDDAVEITSVIMPASPNDLMILPEGERFLPNVKIYTEHQICIGDFIVYKDDTYRISTNPDWSNYGFYNAIATKHAGTAKPNSGGFEIT